MNESMEIFQLNMSIKAIENIDNLPNDHTSMFLLLLPSRYRFGLGLV